MCRLGGYTSRLLGYRTRLYSLCQDSNCSEDIDIIMFGKERVFVSEILCDIHLTKLKSIYHYF